MSDVCPTNDELHALPTVLVWLIEAYLIDYSAVVPYFDLKQHTFEWKIKNCRSRRGGKTWAIACLVVTTKLIWPEKHIEISGASKYMEAYIRSNEFLHSYIHGL